MFAILTDLMENYDYSCFPIIQTAYVVDPRKYEKCLLRTTFDECLTNAELFTKMIDKERIILYRPRKCDDGFEFLYVTNFAKIMVIKIVTENETFKNLFYFLKSFEIWLSPIDLSFIKLNMDLLKEANEIIDLVRKIKTNNEQVNSKIKKLEEENVLLKKDNDNLNDDLKILNGLNNKIIENKTKENETLSQFIAINEKKLKQMFEETEKMKDLLKDSEKNCAEMRSLLDEILQSKTRMVTQGTSESKQ